MAIFMGRKYMSGSSVPHHVENRDQKKVGINIAVIAVLMTIMAACANNEANRMIVKEIESSNGFAWYQAKRQRSYLNELELRRIQIDLSGNPTDAQRKLLEESQAKLKAKNAEYEKESAGIQSKAEADKRDAEAAHHRHSGFEYAEILLNIAVVLCSLTLLTEARLYFRLGLLTTAGGVVLAIWALMQTSHEEHRPAEVPSATVPPQR
jgi:Domain of unknown function (DUF4337)